MDDLENKKEYPDNSWDVRIASSEEPVESRRFLVN
jgi:hypothetical protein